MRWACAKFLRQTFHELAAFSVRHSVWAGAFYEQKRAQGKDHHGAVRALAFKWIRILYRCWQDGRPYEESRYLEALERRARRWRNACPLLWKASESAVDRCQKNPPRPLDRPTQIAGLRSCAASRLKGSIRV